MDDQSIDIIDVATAAWQIARVLGVNTRIKGFGSRNNLVILATGLAVNVFISRSHATIAKTRPTEAKSVYPIYRDTRATGFGAYSTDGSWNGGAIITTIRAEGDDNSRSSTNLALIISNGFHAIVI